jgi:hypothetical protein
LAFIINTITPQNRLQFNPARGNLHWFWREQICHRT